MADSKPGLRKPVFTKVDQLRPGTSGHTLTVKVVDAKMVMQKGRSDGPQSRQMRIAECLVGDETGMIIFTARNDQGIRVILLSQFCPCTSFPYCIMVLVLSSYSYVYIPYNVGLFFSLAGGMGVLWLFCMECSQVMCQVSRVLFGPFCEHLSFLFGCLLLLVFVLSVVMY